MLLDTQWQADDRFEVDVATIAAPALVRLDDLALQVIALARKDRLSSVTPPSASGRLVARLFGIHAAAGLADPVLEALRRYCVLTRHRAAKALQAWDALRDAGYTEADRRLVDALIAG